MTSTSSLKIQTSIYAGKAQIFGTNWCGFTTKQINAFKEKNIPFDFINCEDNENAALCKGISAYPVVKNYPNVGDQWEGFKSDL